MHLVSATDHQRFQAVILPAQARGLLSFFDQQLKEIIIDRLVAIAKPFPEDQEPSIGQLRWHLFEHESEHKKEATAYAARSFLPLVQIPPDGIWGAGTRASYTTAERWLGKADASNFPALIHRYLAAFGPASVIDFQTWVGMTNQMAHLVSTVAGLVAYRSETGQVLYDLPDQPILNAETKAPVRFLPEYDNILITHKDQVAHLARTASQESIPFRGSCRWNRE